MYDMRARFLADAASAAGEGSRPLGRPRPARAAAFLSPPAPARPPEPPPLLPLADALAVPAGWLATGRVRSAELVVDAQGIAVQTSAVYGPRRYRWTDLAAQVRALADDPRAWPSETAALAPEAFARWPVLLRLVGRLLDRQHVRSCVIHARVARPYAPMEWDVRVTAEGQVLLDSATVRRYLRRLRLAGGAQSQSALAVERAVPWRRIAAATPRAVAVRALRPAQDALGARLLGGIPRPRAEVGPPARALGVALAALRQRAPRLDRTLPEVCGYMLPAGPSGILERATRWLRLEQVRLRASWRPARREGLSPPAPRESAVLSPWQARLARLRGLLDAVAGRVPASVTATAPRRR